MYSVQCTVCSVQWWVCQEYASKWVTLTPSNLRHLRKHCSALNYSALNCTAVLTCTAMNGITLDTNILLCNAIYYYELHCSALYSAALQCTTLLLCTHIHCTALQWTSHVMWVSAGKQRFLKIANSWLSLMLYLLNKGMSQPSGEKEGPVQRFVCKQQETAKGHYRWNKKVIKNKPPWASALHHWVKSYRDFLNWWIFWIGGFCLLVELHLEGSAHTVSFVSWLHQLVSCFSGWIIYILSFLKPSFGIFCVSNWQ